MARLGGILIAEYGEPPCEEKNANDKDAYDPPMLKVSTKRRKKNEENQEREGKAKKESKRSKQREAEEANNKQLWT